MQDELNVNFDVAYPISDTVTCAAALSSATRSSRSGSGRSSPGTSVRSRRRASARRPTASPASATRSPAAGAAATTPGTSTSEGAPTDPLGRSTLAAALGGFRGLRHHDERQGRRPTIASTKRSPCAAAGAPASGRRRRASRTRRTSRRSSTSTLQDLVNNGTIPSTNPGGAAARRQGARARRSRRTTASGAVLELGNFTVTADYYSDRRGRPHGRVAGLRADSGGGRGAGRIRRHERGESAELPLLHERLRYRDQGHRPRGDLQARTVRRRHRTCSLRSTTTRPR